MLNILAIGVGGFLGAISRYLLSGLPARLFHGSFPYGTLLVNVSGCFIIGALMFLVEEKRLFSDVVRSFVIIGFLGSLTTFSTFSYDTLKLFREAEAATAILNVSANVILSLAAVWVGWSMMKIVN